MLVKRAKVNDKNYIDGAIPTRSPIELNWLLKGTEK